MELGDFHGEAVGGGGVNGGLSHQCKEVLITRLKSSGFILSVRGSL